MTTASFYKKNGKFQKFRISGHSGYAEEGSDIVCAAVSAMTMLTVNNITDMFGIPSDVSVDEDTADIELKLISENEIAHALIAGLYNELSVLANDYSEYLRVIVK